MKTIISMLLITVTLLSITSCKKEAAIIETRNDVSKINNLKNWYSKVRQEHSSSFRRDSADSPIGDPEWDSTHSYLQNQTSRFVIPMRFESESSNTNQFIIIQVNASGIIVSGEYVYIILDSTITNNYTKEQLETLNPEVFDYQNIPIDLKAWVVKYDLNNEPIDAKYVSQASAETKDMRFSKTSYNKAAEGECIAPICFEWFIDTYVNGILIHTESTGTITCTCFGGFTGGGGGGGTPGGGGGSTPVGGNGDDPPCNYSAAQAEQLANEMEGENLLDGHLQTLSFFPSDGLGVPDYRQSTFTWDFYNLHYFANYNAIFSAIYTGATTRDCPNCQWKWINITYSGAWQTSGTVPICFSSTCNAASTQPEIKSDGVAQATITYTITTNISCLGGVQWPDIISGSNTNQFMVAN